MCFELFREMYYAVLANDSERMVVRLNTIISDEQRLKTELINICHQIYKGHKLNPSAIAWPMHLKQWVRFGWDNRLSFALVRRLCGESGFSDSGVKADLKIWHERDKAYTQTLCEALSALHQVADGEPWLLIKTVSGYPHYTSDIDVLVQDKITEERFNKQLVFSRWNREASGSLKAGFLPIDIDMQSRISWTDSEEMSADFVWKNSVHSDLEGIPFKQPNKLCDTLIRIGHIMFELAEVRLGELLHIYQQSVDLDWSMLEAEATANAWPKTYRYIARLLCAMHVKLFDRPLCNLVDPGLKLTEQIHFPYRIPYHILASAVVEKRAWKKLWGARYLLKDRIMGVQ